MSSLATQLQSIASLDASRLTSRTGSPSSKSYLFPPKTAASHDLDSIYALAQSGYEELVSLDPGFGEYEDELFSERARRVDRMLLNKEENARLGRVLERCLRRLGRWIGVLAGGKCIEWLVRRFRVHEMNSEVLLQVFLPYHSSPNFPRILAILTLPPTSPWHAPFSPLIKSPQIIPRSYITTAISPGREKSLRLLESVVGVIKQGLQEGIVHRAMLGFWTGVMVELLEKGSVGGLNESLVKIMVEGFVDLLTTRSAGVDVNAAVYPPLVLLSRTIRLADEPFLAILEALLTPESGANPSQRALTLLVLLNDRPGWTLGLGEDASGKLAKIPQLGDLLSAGLEKYGLEEAVAVIAVVMAERPDLNEAHLTTLLEISDLPPTLVAKISSKLFITGLAASSPENARLSSRSLLSNLRERHPIQVDSAFAEVSKSGDIDHTLIHKSTVESAFTDVYGADTSARVAGVKRMFEMVRDTTTTDDEALDGNAAKDRVSARDAILARLSDTDQAVLQAIYEDDSASQVLGLDAQYIMAVKPAFVARHPDQAILKIHLRYILANTGEANIEGSRMVFEELLFPCLLSTTSRVTLDQESWQLLLDNSQAFDALKTLVGHVKRSAIAQLENGAMSPQIIDGIVNSIAEGMTASSDFDHYVTFLMQRLDSITPSSKHLAHLVLARIIQITQGEHQAEVALRLLHHLEPLRSGKRFTDIDGSEGASTGYVEAVLKDLDSKKTVTKGRSLLLSSLARVNKPAGESFTWVGGEQIESRNSGYKAFATVLYTWINSETLPLILSGTLLRSLFTQLGENALIFLASVWTASPSSQLRAAALRHALAFISAHDTTVDFQLIIPGLLIALTDEDKDVRQAAVDIVRKISAKGSDSGGNIYALDTFYCDRSSLVQLIKPVDLTRYLAAIVEAGNEIVLDRKRIQGVNASVLGAHSGKNRKDSSPRRAIIGALLSHVQAWRSLEARLSILSTLSTIKDLSVFRGVLPLLAQLADDLSEESKWLSSRSEDDQGRYTAALFHTMSVHSAKLFAEEEGEGWKFALKCLDGNASVFGPRLRDMSLQKMIAGIFETLHQSQKVTYISTLVRSLHDVPTGQVFTSKAALSKLNLSTPTLNAILQNILEPLEAAPQRKKQKQAENGQANETELAVADITAVIESRTWKDVPGDANLVAGLMDVLSALLSRKQGMKEGVDYLEQETLGAILALVEKIQDAAEIQKAHVGIEVIIKVIRASINPRTSQRALLVASELARLIPESVLHNIMPIFTFMGASDFQRDDAYSFGVVEKTVASIVPVMTRSLKEKATSKLELYNESLAFLSIFTDMEGRLPKHRTLPFFVHLVNSLGPAEFLAPVAMLLLEKAIPRSGKTPGASDLPYGITATFDLDTRLEVVYESIEETGRLVADLSQEEQTAFLSRAASGDVDRSVKQISSLLHFTSGILRQALGKVANQSIVERIVSRSITLGGAISSRTISSQVDVKPTLEAALQLLSADNFLKIVSTLLDEEREEDIKMSLDVLVDRLPRIKSEIRISNVEVVAAIIKKTASHLVRSNASTVVTAALSALRAVIASAQSGEDAAIAGIVSQLVGVVMKISDVFNLEALLSLLDLTIRRVGSRVIPFIQPLTTSILPLTTSTNTTRKASSAITAQAFKVFTALIETVPTFLAAKQLSSVLHAAIQYRAVDPDVAKSVISTASRKIPTKSLVPVVIELWGTVKAEQEDSMQAFFDLLRQTLKHADRAALPPIMKTLFAFFLQVFDLRHHLQIRGMDQAVINGIEESAIGSFLELVTKMNEVGFKPLWGRLVDWGVIELGEGKGIDDGRSIERKTVLLHVMLGLLTRFKHLLSPYIGTLLPHIQDELLPAFAAGQLSDLPLWQLLHQTLSRSFEVDDGAFWTDESLLKIIPLLITQLPLFTSTQPSPPVQALASLAAASSSEQLLKSLNSSICLSTRSDDAKTRLAGVKALDGIWAAQSEGLLPFVPETVSEFLGELLEDENGDVEVAARKLLSRIEGLTGSLKEYLE